MTPITIPKKNYQWTDIGGYPQERPGTTNGDYRFYFITKNDFYILLEIIKHP